MEKKSAPIARLLKYRCLSNSSRVILSIKKKFFLINEIIADFRTSKLFENAPEDTIEDLTNLNITYNSHNYCLTEETFVENDLVRDWRVISTNKDVNGFEFISSFESRTYPFYSIQFHPEKVNFEFRLGANIPHGAEAIKTSQYFANFFVEETKKNSHKFPDWLSEQDALIYNYSPHFTGLQNSTYLQLYMFLGESQEKNVIMIWSCTNSIK